MSQRNVLAIALAGLVAGFAPVAQAAPNIVINGDFETGSMSSWTVTGTSYTWATTNTGLRTGNYAAYMGCVGANCLNAASPTDTLSQVLATTNGASYTLTFSFDPGTSTPNGLSVLWGTTTVYSITDAVSTGSLKTITVTNLIALSNAMKLTFLGRQDPSYIRIDNVVVTAVPEPQTWGLTMLGFAVLGMTMRKGAKGTKRQRIRMATV